MSSVQYMQVFLHALNHQEAALEAALAAEPFDPGEFFQFARRHTVAGHLYGLLSDAGWLELLPSALEDKLAEVHQIQLEKADRLLPETQRLRQGFEQAGIDVIFMKGPFLSKRFYGDARRRFFGDIDLLVRDRRDLVRSDAVLRGAGYERRSIRLLGHRTVMRFAYHFVYRGENAKIDLHWALRSHFSYRIDRGRLWATKKTVSLGGHEFSVLSAEYVLVLLMLSVLTDYQKARVRLKFMTDLFMVLRSVGDDTDWEAFFQRRQQEGLLRISLTVLDLVLGLFGAPREFKSLSRALSSYAELGKDYRLAAPKEFLEWSEKPRDKLRNHLWTFRLHEGGMTRSLGWRLLAEPFGRAVFR